MNDPSPVVEAFRQAVDAIKSIADFHVPDIQHTRQETLAQRKQVEALSPALGLSPGINLPYPPLLDPLSISFTATYGHVNYFCLGCVDLC